MVKRLKAMAAKANSGDNQLAAAVRDSAQQIWLAGLGAFAKAQEEGQKVFEALVKEGTTLQKRTVRMTEDTVNEVTGKVGKVTGELSRQANGTWDKLEGVFEERVARAMGRLGVPTKREIADLTARVEELTAAVDGLTGSKPRRAAKARAKAKDAKAPVARKRAPRKSAAGAASAAE